MPYAVTLEELAALTLLNRYIFNPDHGVCFYLEGQETRTTDGTPTLGSPVVVAEIFSPAGRVQGRGSTCTEAYARAVATAKTPK